MLRFRFLKITASFFIAWDLCRNGQHRNPAAMAIIKTVDQMQIAGTTTPGAHCQFSREMRLCSGGKRCCLFVAHMNPADLFLSSDRIGDAVQRVAGNSVNPLDSCRRKSLHQYVGYCLRCPGSASLLELAPPADKEMRSCAAPSPKPS